MLRAADELLRWRPFPCFVKLPIGTASRATWRVEGVDGLRALYESGALGEVSTSHPVVVQAAVPGPLVMVQALFDRGRLVRLHACRRVLLGPGGGAAVKESLDVAGLRGQASRLGADLGWHGPLSADLLLGPMDRAGST